jgi:hypothetical protein
MTSFNFGKLRFSGVDHSTPALATDFPAALDSTVLDTGAFEDRSQNYGATVQTLAMAETPKSEPNRSTHRSQDSRESRTEPDGQGGGIHIGRVFFAQGLTTIMDTAAGVAMTSLGGWFTARASEPLWSGAGAVVTLGCAALVWNQFRSGNISWQQRDKPDS